MDQGTDDVIGIEPYATVDRRIGPHDRLRTTVAGHPTAQRGLDREPVVRPPSQRDKIEVLGLLLYTLGILLGLALTIGPTLPSAP